MSSNSFTFIPGQSDAQPAQPAQPQQPAQPAQPRESIEQIGGMTRFSMRFDPPKGQDIENPDRGTPVDADGHVRVRLNEAPRHQSFTFTPDSGASTSFVNASGMPASPDTATHVKIPDGRGGYDLTTVGAAEAIGLVVKGAGGNYQATGKSLRNGQVVEQHEIPQMLEQDAAAARMDHVRATLDAVRNAYGEEKFNAMVEDHFKGGGDVHSLVAGILGEPVPAGNGNGDDAPWKRGQPAIPMLPEEQRAMQPRPAPVDPAASIPDRVDGRVPALAAAEAAMTEGLNPSAIQATKAAIAAGLASGADGDNLKLVISNLATETGCTPQRAQEIVNTIGRSIGAVTTSLAAKLGVPADQLFAAMQRYDSESLGAAISSLAVSRNASQLAKLAARTVAAASRRGNR